MRRLHYVKPGASTAPDDLFERDPKNFWRSRGYLPHFDKPGMIQMVAFGLHDALPAEVVDEWRERLTLQRGLRPTHPELSGLPNQAQRLLDAGHGACHLKDPRIATVVENAFLHFDGQRYKLLAWVVMPNHVHVLVELFVGYPLSGIVQSWKSFTAKEANKILGRRGRFWRREYYDRFIRNERHFEKALDYIRTNPTEAGLVAKPHHWRFSSWWEGRTMPARGQRSCAREGAISAW